MRTGIAWASILLAAASAGADEDTGEAIYRKQCASCHGARGEGTREHPEALVGDRPLEKLALFIEKNMPEDAPGKCVGVDARKVAAYIHDAFYSRAAQARNAPPKIELARLTVGQYRNSMADLIATFTEPGKEDDRRGLRAEFFNSGRRLREEKRVLERLDPAVDFKFAASGPAEKIALEEYAGRWSGALLAPETGEYQFVLETGNGARLWINDTDRPLIDVWVRSGDQKVHRETIFLLGGRLYPLRVEFFKEKKEKSASIALRWKAPHRVEELLSERHLSPGRFPDVFILKTPFPPDDRSMGYERGTSVSKAWDEAATYAAVEAAEYVYTRLKAQVDAQPQAREMGRRFAERAFRRPLTPEQQRFFVDRHFEGNADLEAAVKKVVLLVLKSPRFLYREVGAAEPDAYDVASRISYAMWDSLPDRELLESARMGRLATPEGVVREIERRVPDPRTRVKIREFYHQWLQLDRLHELTKDLKRFPEFNEAIVSDLRTSLDLFLEDVTWSEASDFRQLLLADFVYLNGRLARFYGADLPVDAPFQKVSPGPGKHAGLMTHPLLMAGFAYDSTTSPIHRGLFVARSLLGRRLRPPPEAVVPLNPELHPEMTTRERITLQTGPQACQSCHATINPLGFAMENYDAVGRFRSTEQGRPIDASGSFWTRSGDAVRFNGARELGASLARNEETQAAFIEHLFHFLVKQPILAHGLDRPEVLRQDFVKSGTRIRTLLVRMIASSATAGGRTTKGKSP